ncbi:MAG: DUF4286 family protein [Flavisolibacter sp.]
MIIYNVTVKVETEIAEKWLKWLLHEHIPEIMKTRCFIDYKVARLLEVDDSDGPTYAIQYHADSRDDYDRYIKTFSSIYIKQSFDKWGDQSYSFQSVLQVVN